MITYQFCDSAKAGFMVNAEDVSILDNAVYEESGDVSQRRRRDAFAFPPSERLVCNGSGPIRIRGDNKALYFRLRPGPVGYVKPTSFPNSGTLASVFKVGLDAPLNVVTGAVKWTPFDRLDLPEEYIGSLCGLGSLYGCFAGGVHFVRLFLEFDNSLSNSAVYLVSAIRELLGSGSNLAGRTYDLIDLRGGARVVGAGNKELASRESSNCRSENKFYLAVDTYLAPTFPKLFYFSVYFILGCLGIFSFFLILIFAPLGGKNGRGWVLLSLLLVICSLLLFHAGAVLWVYS